MEWQGTRGQIIEIIERGIDSLVGEFHPLTDEQRKISPFIGYALSNNKKLHKYRVYLSENGLMPQMGDMVKVTIKIILKKIILNQ